MSSLSTLTAGDIEHFKKLKAQAIENFTKAHDHYQKCAELLLLIKRRELWRAEKHENWSAFLDHVADKLDKTPRRLFQIIREAETRFKLLKSFQQKSPNLRKIVEKMKPKALLEVAKLPEEKQAAVVELAAKQFSNAPPSAPAVAAAAKVQKPKKGEEIKDVKGHVIPPPALPFWERRNEVQPWLNQLSAMKVAIEKAKSDGDSLYSWIGTPAIDALQNAYTTITNAKLTNVCTKCEGWWDRMSGGGCSTCHNTGLICKHQYEVCSPKEIKDMREKSDKKA